MASGCLRLDTSPELVGEAAYRIGEIPHRRGDAEAAHLFFERAVIAGSVLELAIGTGRIALPLAARGVPVAGNELSEPMVNTLHAKPGGADLPVVIGDMAAVTVPGEFQVAYLVFNTIFNLTTQDDQVRCFQNAAKHLSPDGAFVIETAVPNAWTASHEYVHPE